MITRRLAAWLGAAVVIVACGLPMFTQLGATDFKGDEPIYAFAVDRMLDQGDWLTPKSIPYDHRPFLEKPPLQFWMIAASVRAGLLPQNEFGYRFLDVLFGIAAFLYVYAIGLRLSGVVCGLTAVLVLFGHEPLVLDHGLRSNNMEAPLVLSYCAGIFHAIAWSEARSRGRRWGHAMAVGLWFVLGFMTKFVAAVFLPGILVVMLVFSRRWRARMREDWRIWIATIAVTAALILPWFLYQYDLQGTGFWAIIFGQHILVRFTAYLDPSHLHPWYFYLTSMAREFSWSHVLILVSVGLVLLAYRAVRHRSDVATLMLLWFVLPVAAISTGTSKLYHYIYPFLPPLAVGAGLVPMTIMDAARRHQDLLGRMLEQISTRVSARIPTLIRRALIGVAVVAIALAAVTPIVGSISFHIGDTLFRSSTTSRPLIVATVLLIITGLFRMIPMIFVAVLLLVALPFDAYRNVKALEVGQAKADDAPLRHLRDCLLERQARGAAPGVYVHARDGGQWKYVYYLRAPGWHIDDTADDQQLAERLLNPGTERPVFLLHADYLRFRQALASNPQRVAEVRRLDGLRRIMWDDGWVMLLPGPYAACGDVKGISVHRIG